MKMPVYKGKMMMTMMMQPGLDDVSKQRMLQAQALSKEARGGKNWGDTLACKLTHILHQQFRHVLVRICTRIHVFIACDHIL